MYREIENVKLYNHINTIICNNIISMDSENNKFNIGFKICTIKIFQITIVWIFQIITLTVQNKLFEENTVFNNDPARFIKIKSWTPELRNMVLKLGPCQPNKYKLENKIFPKNTYNRSFHSSWYTRKLIDNSFVNREWLTYSSKLDKIFCLYCILYSVKSNGAWIKNGFNYWTNGY